MREIFEILNETSGIRIFAYAAITIVALVLAGAILAEIITSIVDSICSIFRKK
jgi:hypothetical protein